MFQLTHHFYSDNIPQSQPYCTSRQTKESLLGCLSNSLSAAQCVRLLKQLTYMFLETLLYISFVLFTLCFRPDCVILVNNGFSKNFSTSSYPVNILYAVNVWGSFEHILFTLHFSNLSTLSTSGGDDNVAFIDFVAFVNLQVASIGRLSS